jgi:hypothetical protein
VRLTMKRHRQLLDMRQGRLARHGRHLAEPAAERTSLGPAYHHLRHNPCTSTEPLRSSFRLGVDPQFSFLTAGLQA